MQEKYVYEVEIRTRLVNKYSYLVLWFYSFFQSYFQKYQIYRQHKFVSELVYGHK